MNKNTDPFLRCAQTVCYVENNLLAETKHSLMKHENGVRFMYMWPHFSFTSVHMFLSSYRVKNIGVATLSITRLKRVFWWLLVVIKSGFWLLVFLIYKHTRVNSGAARGAKAHAETNICVRTSLISNWPCVVFSRTTVTPTPWFLYFFFSFLNTKMIEINSILSESETARNSQKQNRESLFQANADFQLNICLVVWI